MSLSLDEMLDNFCHMIVEEYLVRKQLKSTLQCLREEAVMNQHILCTQVYSNLSMSREKLMMILHLCHGEEFYSTIKYVFIYYKGMKLL